MTRIIAIALLSICSFGCTSFRTTSLYRFSNDTLKPQHTSGKLKGIPVKLKVPTHLLVTVSEQQLVLARSPEDGNKVLAAAAEAAEEVSSIRARIATISENINQSRQLAANYESQVVVATNEIATTVAAIAAATDQADKDILEQKKKSQETWRDGLRASLVKAKIAESEASFAGLLRTALEDELNAKIDVARRLSEDASIKYSLIAFDPAQFVVDTELQYTDKVFLVDFKRPAGGILDLKNATMDDEQYFAQVAADVTENTISDINTALNTVKGPLSELGKPKTTPNIAIPTSSGSSPEEANIEVNFQKSVVAIQRFDISEAGWEERVQAFVNEHLSRTMVRQEPPTQDPYMESYIPIQPSL